MTTEMWTPPSVAWSTTGAPERRRVPVATRLDDYGVPTTTRGSSAYDKMILEEPEVLSAFLRAVPGFADMKADPASPSRFCWITDEENFPCLRR
jgi:hypothetical protein